jgi:hypothetical protein
MTILTATGQTDLWMRTHGYVPFVCPNATPNCDTASWIDKETDSQPLKERDKYDRECNVCRAYRVCRRQAAAARANATKLARGTNYQAFCCLSPKLPPWLEYVTPCKKHADCKADASNHPPPAQPLLAIRCARDRRRYQQVLVKDKIVHDPRRVRVVIVTGKRSARPQSFTYEMLKREGRVLLAPLAVTLVRLVVCPEDKVDEHYTQKYGATAE